MKTLSDPIVQTPAADVEAAPQTQNVQVPRTMAGATLRSLRLDVALACVMPAIYGALFAWWQTGLFLLPQFAFALAGVLTTVLSWQALVAVYDHQCSLSVDARPADDLPDTPFRLMSNGMLPPAILMNLGLLLLTIGTLCSLWLTLLAGWPILFFSGLSCLLMAAAVLPPVQYAYRGWGVGELGLALSLGLLPLLGSYYAQTQTLDRLPVASGLPLMILVFLVIFNQNLGTWHRDWLIGKRTLVVLLGCARALDLSVLLTIVAYAAILLVTVLARLPLWQLVGLVTLPLVMGAFADIRRADVTAENGYRLRNATAKATIWTGVLLSGALFISQAG